MAINFKELNKLTKFARKNGITSIKVDGIELGIDASALQPTKRRTRKADEIPAYEEQYTEEQILNWSSTPQIPGEAN